MYLPDRGEVKEEEEKPPVVKEHGVGHNIWEFRGTGFGNSLQSEQHLCTA